MTASTRTFTYTVTPPVDPGGSGTPAWFTPMPSLSWKAMTVGSGVSGVGGDNLSSVAISASYRWPTSPENGGAADPLQPAAPVFGPNSNMNSPSNYCQNSNGMAVDPVTGDCFLVSNGGHGGYMGNETMRINFRATTPTWERYIDSTPPWHVNSQSSIPGQFTSADQQANENWAYVCFTDGPAHSTDFVANPTYSIPAPYTEIKRRPATTHTSCLPTFANDRVWLPLQNSSNFAGGCSSFWKTSIDIAARRADPALKLWKYGDIAPWTIHGVMNDAVGLQPKGQQSLFLFPTSGLDESTGRIWICPATSSSMRYFWMLETRGPNAGKHQTFQNTGIFLRTQGAVGGAVCCNANGTGVINTSGAPVKLFVLYGRRIFARDVYVLDISALEAANPTLPYTGIVDVDNWSQYVAQDASPQLWINSERFALGDDPQGAWGPQQAWGCVWHQGSNGLLMFNCDHAVDLNRQRNGHLRKLALPLDSNGRYNPTLPWRFIDVATTGTVPGTCVPGGGLVTGGSFSRFNIMRNFDSLGNDLLISINAWDNAASVMKIPGTGV